MAIADPALPLIKSVRAAMLADGVLSAALGDRVALEWGDPLASPFARIHVPSSRPWFGDDASDEAMVSSVPCDDFDRGTRSVVNVHLWGTQLEVMQIAARVVSVLHDAALTVDGHELAGLRARETLHRTDSDDPTLRHSIVGFTAATIP